MVSGKMKADLYKYEYNGIYKKSREETMQGWFIGRRLNDWKFVISQFPLISFRSHVQGGIPDTPNLHFRAREINIFFKSHSVGKSMCSDRM